MRKRICATIIVVFALSGAALAQSPPGGYDHLFDRAAAPAQSPAAPPSRTAIQPSSPVLRATYQDGPALNTAPPALKRPEPMPIGNSSHDGTDSNGSRVGRHDLPAAPSAIPAMTSMILSLLVVLGLFFGLAWLMKRGLPKGARLLSSDVVQVLGRAPLGGRQQMHVVRFGNKLLLVSLSPGGVETLSEIVDPVEVDRLAGICQQADAHSATNAFRSIFRQFGEERRTSGQRLPTRTEADDV
jgi:flagellar biosynthetic protein FliO